MSPQFSIAPKVICYYYTINQEKCYRFQIKKVPATKSGIAAKSIFFKGYGISKKCWPKESSIFGPIVPA